MTDHQRRKGDDSEWATIETGRGVTIQSRTHDRDLTAEILHGEALGFEHLCIPMEHDPHHPLSRREFENFSWQYAGRFQGPTPKKRTTRRQRKERERRHERAFAQGLLIKAKEKRRIEHWSRVSTSLFGKYPEERNQDAVDALGYAWRAMFERSKTSP